MIKLTKAEGYEIIKSALANVLADKERSACPVARAFIGALNSYADKGLPFSKLSWFKGLEIFELLDYGNVDVAIEEEKVA
ncbi:hypothetical protein RsTz2092_07230 [Deferribacterales bacterium RsTz2092]|nr:hypothetical protein AGMMS49941_04140 [Deferribacterales bacterium]